MKRIPSVGWLCGVLLLAGCAHHYDITLTNGVRIDNVSRPVLDRDAGVYVYKDGTGQLRQIPSGRVVEIAPHNRAKVGNFRNSSDSGPR